MVCIYVEALLFDINRDEQIQMVLGRSMDKKMRMSDWEKRPLSINQVLFMNSM